MTEVRERQIIFIKILTNNKISADEFLIGAQDFFDIEKQEWKFPNHLSLPRDKNGVLIKSFIKLIQFYYYIRNNKILYEFDIPVVAKDWYKALKISITPGLQDNVLTLINPTEDIVILNENNKTGYFLTLAEYNACPLLENIRVCDIKKPEENIVDTDHCLANLVFKNSTLNCQIKAVKISHDIWIPTNKLNTWQYLAPYPTTLNISVNDKWNSITIFG